VTVLHWNDRENIYLILFWR